MKRQPCADPAQAILLNSLAVTLGPDLCQQFVIPEVVNLAEDPVFRVRKTMAFNLDNVCRTAGPENSLTRIVRPTNERMTRRRTQLS